MGASAFSNCHNLKTVIIHDGAKVIGDKAFRECSKLEAIYVPVSMKKIGKDAFPDNYNLKIVTDFKSTAAKYARNHGIDLVEPDPDESRTIVQASGRALHPEKRDDQPHPPGRAAG